MRRIVLCSALVLAACPKPPPPSTTGDAGPSFTPWKPGTILPTPREPSARGFLDRRGLVHAHSIYSHDACDNQPVDDAGVRDQACLADFRRGLCQSHHDFVFLSDHRDAFNTTEFPEALLYRPALGDVLIERDGQPIANRMSCDDGSAPIIMAGCEGNAMPVGLTRHAAATPEERDRLYGSITPDDIMTMKAAGAVMMAQHTENYTADQLATLPFDGFEMFNVHANLELNAGNAVILLLTLGERPEELPHPDLVLWPIITEDERYISSWGSVLSRAKRVTTMGSDCHRNTFKALMPDGERVDSYRRIMISFSNHLLVRARADGTYTDEELREALRSGRAFGVFEFLGFPSGFDFHAADNGTLREMGEEAAVGAHLVVTMPALELLDPSAEPPDLSARILKAKEGGWDVVAEGKGDLDVTVMEPGAYRAEIRMKARHLRAFGGVDADVLVERDLPWVYSNAIYVRN